MTSQPASQLERSQLSDDDPRAESVRANAVAHMTRTGIVQEIPPLKKVEPAKRANRSVPGNSAVDNLRALGYMD